MRRRAVTLALIAVCCVAGFLLWPDPLAKQVLPDGTVLVFSGVKVGRTNVYSHGAGLSKALGRLVPSNGVSVAGFTLQRPQLVVMAGPEGGEILTAELGLGPGSPQEKLLITPPFYRRHRWLISGDDADSFTFVKEFNGFQQQADGLFDLVQALSYPRDSRRLRFRLEQRETRDSRDWREIATFVVRNPKPARVEPWQPARSPRIRLADGLEVEVGELAVRHEPINTNDIWEHTAFLPVRVFRNGQVATNWGIQGGKIWDASGNFDNFSYGHKFTTNDWTTYGMFRPLDPAKVWKFQVRFARDSDFPATNLFSFTVTCPLANAIQTNLGGSPVWIAVRTDKLIVEMANTPPHVSLTFVKAVDDAGNDLSEHSGSWGQHNFWKRLKLSRPGSPTPVQVHATVAIHETYEAEFMLQPRNR